MEETNRIASLAVMCVCMAFLSCSIIGPAINSAGLGSAKGVQKRGSVNGKEPVTPDADPPADYSPTFLGQAAPVPITQVDSSIIAQLTRVEVNDPNYLKLYIHFVDQDGNYVSGATAAAMKQYWCDVQESFDSTTYVIDDFTVREETAADSVPLALALVMDHSGSIGESRAFAIQGFVDEFLQHKQREDQMALIKFDHHVEVESPFLANQNQLRSRLKKVGLFGFGGWTAMLDGVDQAVDLLKQVKGFDNRKNVLVFTDGYENASTHDLDAVLDHAIVNGVHVHTVGFGYNIDEPFLQYIAWRTGGMYQHIYQTNQFDDMFADSYFREKNFYVVQYKPKNYGKLTITVKLCFPEGDQTLVANVDYPPPRQNVPALINILFPFDSCVLDAKYDSEIDKVYRVMTDFYPTCTVELHGHTDWVGTDEYNINLSQCRAEAVKEALVRKGIDAARITVVGFGESQPVAPNDTEEGRKKNRRTEFVIKSVN